MAIPAVRFNPLDKDFSAPMKSIKTSDPSIILNDASNSISSVASDLLKTVGQLAQDLNINNIVSKITNLKNSAESATGISKFLSSVGSVSTTVRQVQGLFQSTINTDLNALKDIDKIRDQIFGNDPVKNNLVRTLDNSLFGKSSKNVTTGKPYSPVILGAVNAPIPPAYTSAVVTGNPNINYPVLVKTVQALVGPTNYQQTVVDQNSLLMQAVYVANYAYEANLTGVMLAIKEIPGMTPEILSRVVAIVMTEQASNGNSTAILDMASGATSVVLNGQTPIYASPSILSDTLANFTSPIGMTNETTLAVSDALLTSMENLDAYWNVSLADGIPSTKHLETGSQDLFGILRTRAVNHVFDELHLTNPFNSTDDAIIVAMIANDPSGLNGLKALGASGSCSSTFCGC